MENVFCNKVCRVESGKLDIMWFGFVTAGLFANQALWKSFYLLENKVRFQQSDRSVLTERKYNAKIVLMMAIVFGLEESERERRKTIFLIYWSTVPANAVLPYKLYERCNWKKKALNTT